jgi:hypothetical protein
LLRRVLPNGEGLLRRLGQFVFESQYC